jgi:hypothetical protein
VREKINKSACHRVESGNYITGAGGIPQSLGPKPQAVYIMTYWCLNVGMAHEHWTKNINLGLRCDVVKYI